ncbi:MAG: hypothetical protein U0572_07360 [Phycisphaerales bacterium]
MQSTRITCLAVLFASFTATGLFADRPAPKAEKPQAEGGIAGGAAPCSCDADLNHDGVVNGADLGMLLGSWGSGSLDITGDGTVNGADLGVLLGAWGPCSAPTNDLCSDALTISGLAQVAFCTTNATTTGTGPGVDGSCGAFATNIYKDVWFNYVPTGDGTLTLSTCNSADFDTIIAVYSSILPGLNTCPSTDGGLSTSVLVGCNDDAANCPGNTSQLSIDVAAGYAYKIRLGGYNGQGGSGTLSMQFQSVGAQCFDGVLVNGVDGQTKTIFGTTVDNPLTSFPCGNGPSRGEWITYVPTCQAQNVHLSTCHPGTDFDTVVTVWRESITQGCDGILIECVDDTESQACLLDGLYRKSKLDFVASAGEIYHILVAGYNQTTSGNFELTINTDCFNP